MWAVAQGGTYEGDLKGKSEEIFFNYQILM